MIVKIKVNGKVYGLFLYENNENGEISVLDTYDPDSNVKEMHPDMIDNNGVDDLMGTNEQMITITIPELEK